MTTQLSENARAAARQAKCAKTLVSVLAVAVKADLPELSWRIGPGASLVGWVPAAHGRRNEVDEFLQWVDALEMRMGTSLKSGGQVHLQATVDWAHDPRQRGELTRVMVMASVPEDASRGLRGGEL